MSTAKGKNTQSQVLEHELKMEEEEGISLNYIIFTVIIGCLLLLNWLNIFPTFLGINTAIILTLVGGYKIFWGALESLFKRRISVDLAIALAAISALAIKQYLAAAEVVFIMLIGEALESYAVDRTRGAIRKLIDLSPKKARVRRGGRELDVEINDLLVGDRVIVKPGERIPVDGEVVSGRSSVDQSTITGESIPVEKSNGSQVYTGTINQLGALEIRVEKLGQDTILAKIIHLVEEAQAQKAPLQKVADKYAKYFVPLIILIAGGSFLITRDLIRSVSILIIACPCALVLATPTAIFAGIGRLAKGGILVKGGVYLEQLGRVDLIAFDKTGTITQGKPRLVGIVCNPGFSEEKLIHLAATVEQHSEHLLANIVVEEAKKRSIPIDQTEEFIVKPGLGVEAIYKGKRLLVGNRRLLEESDLEFDLSTRKALDEIDRRGQTPILLAMEEKIAGVIAVQDEIRPEAVAAINRLKELGIKKIALLTGDNEKVAAQIAEQTGIDEFLANLLPDAKVAKIREWQKQGHTVAMIGDGINDAPSLSSADVGITLGGIGSDVAIEAADIILMADDLRRLDEAVLIGKKTVKTIKQNILCFAIVFNLLAVIAASTLTWLTPVMAAIVHQISSLLVVSNSLRLLAGKMGSILGGWLESLKGWWYSLGHDHLLPVWEDHYRGISQGLLAILVVFYLASGLTFIYTDQIGVVQRFGRKITDHLPSGLHLLFPWPIDKVTKVRRGVERVEIGFRKTPVQTSVKIGLDPKAASIPSVAYEWEVRDRTGEYQKMSEESLVFTGDENFLEMDMVVQYMVKDPSAFLFKIRGFEDTASLMRFYAQSAIRQTVGQMATDGILSNDRRIIEKEVTALLQKELDQLGAGLLIKGAYLQSVHPPIEVADAFRAVVNAHEEKSMLINQAEGYHNEQVPLARAQSVEKMEVAKGYKVEMVNRSTGEADRFTRMSQYYHVYPEVSSSRLYLEMTENVLPNMKKFILDTKRNGNEELTILGSKKIETIVNSLTKGISGRGKNQNQTEN